MSSEDLQKDFIWKALHEGWSVQKVTENTFKFSKNHGGHVSEFTLQGFLREFLVSCLGNSAKQN